MFCHIQETNSTAYTCVCVCVSCLVKSKKRWLKVESIAVVIAKQIHADDVMNMW